MTTSVLINGPATLAAAVPSLIGFTPATGDGVLIVMDGKRVVLTARFDCPRGELDTLARSLASTAKRQGATHAHVITYGPDAHRPFDLAGALWRAGINCQHRLRVDGGRVFEHYDSITGEALPVDVVRPAAIIEAGAVVRDSRAELEALFDGPPAAPAPDALRLSTILADVALRDQRIGMLADMDGQDLAEELDLAVRTVRAWLPGTTARDAALTYAALVAYLGGDGAIVNIALDRVTGDYSLAKLLRAAIAMAVPPAELRTMMAKL